MSPTPPMQTFPVHVLPPWWAEMIEATATSTQTDPVMPAMISLAVVSSSVARKALVRMPSGYEQPLNLWVLVGAGSGEGKSPVFKAVTAPLQAVQQVLDAPPRAEASADSPRHHDRYERVVELDVTERSAEPPSLDAVVRRLSDTQRLRFPDTPVRLLTQDVTPARLLELMATQVLGLAELVPEGGFAAWLAGSGARAQAEQGLMNLAWDGETIRQERIARDVPTIERACLTIGVGVQPAPLRELVRNASMRDIGCTLRFLVGLSRSRVGLRRSPYPPLSVAAGDGYCAAIWSLLNLPRDDARRIEVSADAGVS